MTGWQYDDAKVRFDELIALALSGEPQVIIRHGEARAVVMSLQAFEALQDPRPDFKEYLLTGPKVNDLTIDRPNDPGREVDV